jgi:hypothetical protein
MGAAPKYPAAIPTLDEIAVRPNRARGLSPKVLARVAASRSNGALRKKQHENPRREGVREERHHGVLHITITQMRIISPKEYEERQGRKDIGTCEGSRRSQPIC